MDLDLLKVHTAALRTALGEPHDHTFEFVEGSLPCKPAPGRFLLTHLE